MTSLQEILAITKPSLHKRVNLPSIRSRKLHNWRPDHFLQDCSNWGNSHERSWTSLVNFLYYDINIEKPRDMHPHLQVALNRSGIFWGKKDWQSFLLVVVFAFFSMWNRSAWVLAAPATNSGMALLKPCCLVAENEALSRWEEMTLQEIPYSSRVTKLSGNNEGMSTWRKGMRCRHTLPWPCTCWFLGMKWRSFGAWARCNDVASD